MNSRVRQTIHAVIAPAIVRWAERQRALRGDIFATERDLENIRQEPLAFSDLLGGEDALGFLRSILDDSEPLYCCDACAKDIEQSGISDDEGYLALTGARGSYWALCTLCASPATHEVTHTQEAL